MSRMSGRIHAFGVGLLLAAAALLSACGGGGSGDTTGPPPGGAGQVDSLVLDLDSVNVIMGDTVRLHGEARDAEGRIVQGIQLTFASSNPAVATVSDEGLVTAVGLGEAEIAVGMVETSSLHLDSGVVPAPSAAVARGRRARGKVVVIPKVVIKPGEQSIDPGTTSQYSAAVTTVNGGALGSYPTIHWSSSKPSVATIDVAGLATAVAEGDTRITAIVSVGASGNVQRSVTLHVAMCGGIFKVVSWSATADVQYEASGTASISQATYRVSQVSTGAADLVKDEQLSNADSVIWDGPAHGSIVLNNSETFPINDGGTGVTSEVKSGEFQAGTNALARLKVKKPAAGSTGCTYSFLYIDYFTWQVTNNQGAPPIPMVGPIGSALDYGAALGARPANGSWVIGGPTKRVQLPGTTLVGATGGFRSAYSPGTAIGIGIVTALGTTLDPRFGEASFAYWLIAK